MRATYNNSRLLFLRPNKDKNERYVNGIWKLETIHYLGALIENYQYHRFTRRSDEQKSLTHLDPGFADNLFGARAGNLAAAHSSDGTFAKFLIIGRRWPSLPKCVESGLESGWEAARHLRFKNLVSNLQKSLDTLSRRGAA